MSIEGSAAPPRTSDAAASRRFSPAAYAALSLLLAWHTVAMVLAALPEGRISDALRTVFSPYITLLRLDNDWGFFAPNVGSGYQFRYIVKDAAGTEHTFTPADTLSRFSPASIWFRDRYRAVMAEPETFAKALGDSLCREHAKLHPVSITLIEIEQDDFWPEDKLAGKKPLDPEFITATPFGSTQCPAT